MPVLISLIVSIVVFAVVAWGLWQLCTYFRMPTPVFWLCGAMLIVVVLLWLTGQLGATSPLLQLRTIR